MSESVPADVDADRPNAARMYDYFLGGAHNFAADRALADRAAAQNPQARAWARANRAFLMWAVRHSAAHGIRQFLDLGSGIPTADHVHTTARAVAPGSRVAYVDVEPVAVAHSRRLLAGVEDVSVTRADIRDPAAVLTASTVTEVLDLDRPVALLAVAILHFVADDEGPEDILDAYTGALVPGSVVALTHSSADYDDPVRSAQLARAAGLYRDSTTPVHQRDRAAIRRLLGDREPVAPGLVDIGHWLGGAPTGEALGSYGGLAPVG